MSQFHCCCCNKHPESEERGLIGSQLQVVAHFQGEVKTGTQQLVTSHPRPRESQLILAFLLALSQIVPFLCSWRVRPQPREWHHPGWAESPSVTISYIHAHTPTCQPTQDKSTPLPGWFWVILVPSLMTRHRAHTVEGESYPLTPYGTCEYTYTHK